MENPRGLENPTTGTVEGEKEGEGFQNPSAIRCTSIFLDFFFPPPPPPHIRSLCLFLFKEPFHKLLHFCFFYVRLVEKDDERERKREG